MLPPKRFTTIRCRLLIDVVKIGDQCLEEWIMEVVSELKSPIMAEPVEAHSPFDKLKANRLQALSERVNRANFPDKLQT